MSAELPKLEFQHRCQSLAELEEYECWRDTGINPAVMTAMTHGEVFATALYQLAKESRE